MPIGVALVGIPQGAPLMVTARGVFCRSGVEFRESYCRQAVIGMKGSGPVSSVNAVRPDRLPAGRV